MNPSFWLKTAIISLIISLALVWPSPALANSTQASFDLSTPQGGPFPSDHFTISDPTQNTGLRIALLKPDCAARPSDCEDIDVLNELDGFNLQPRLSIPPWPFLGVLAVLDLAAGVAALWLRRASLWIAALGASEVILEAWVLLARTSPWPTVALAGTVAQSALAFLWIGLARRVAGPDSKLVLEVTLAAVTSLFLGQPQLRLTQCKFSSRRHRVSTPPFRGCSMPACERDERRANSRYLSTLGKAFRVSARFCG